MELRTREIALDQVYKSSPYQLNINYENKKQILEEWEGRYGVIWVLPVALTFCELACLKYGKLPKANRFNLYKWISIILATVATNFSSAEALRRCLYFERLYPSTTKMQKEFIRDIQILKNSGAAI